MADARRASLLERHWAGSALAIGFAVIAAGHGYPAAWLFAGAVTVGFLPFLALMRPVRGRVFPGRPVAAAPGTGAADRSGRGV